MAAAEAAKGAYEVIWEKKPLGFSIVMDTTGRNAYVSSIQNTGNVKKGLKLAAQIIEINGKNQKDRKHQDILIDIKGASLPISLKFQPRSFANEPDDGLDDIPKVLTFEGAPESNAHRVNGPFELIKTEINDRHVWKRKDDLDDPIYVWYWPMEKSKLETNLWMIGRKSRVNQQGAYACCNADAKLPTEIKKTWKAWDQKKQLFVDADIVIHQSRLD